MTYGEPYPEAVRQCIRLAWCEQCGRTRKNGVIAFANPSGERGQWRLTLRCTACGIYRAALITVDDPEPTGEEIPEPSWYTEITR